MSVSWIMGALGLLLAAAPATAETVLFVGNSFTFGANSAVRTLNADQVRDLNGQNIGGVPGLFSRFAGRMGLKYDVSLETAPGRSLGWHLANHYADIDRRWDHVVLQEYSTLDPATPGDPKRFIEDARSLGRLFAARNPAVQVYLSATWSRPDLVYRRASPWLGQPIDAMANDLRLAYDKAARAIGKRARVVPVGQAFGCAIRTGAADGDPYDGIGFGQIALWSWDHYHASAYGYYLEALTVFGTITGQDPTALGRDEPAAAELGFSTAETAMLQSVASEALRTDGACQG